MTRRRAGSWCGQRVAGVFGAAAGLDPGSAFASVAARRCKAAVCRSVAVNVPVVAVGVAGAGLGAGSKASATVLRRAKNSGAMLHVVKTSRRHFSFAAIETTSSQLKSGASCAVSFSCCAYARRIGQATVGVRGVAMRRGAISVGISAIEQMSLVVLLVASTVSPTGSVNFSLKAV